MSKNLVLPVTMAPCQETQMPSDDTGAWQRGTRDSLRSVRQEPRAAPWASWLDKAAAHQLNDLRHSPGHQQSLTEIQLREIAGGQLAYPLHPVRRR